MSERFRKQIFLRQELAKTQFSNAQAEELGRKDQVRFRLAEHEYAEVKGKGTPGKPRRAEQIERKTSTPGSESGPPASPSSPAAAPSQAATERPADDDGNINIHPGITAVRALAEFSKRFRDRRRVPLAAMLDVHSIASRHGVLRGISGPVAGLAIAHFTARTYGQKVETLFFRCPTLDTHVDRLAAEQAYNVLWLHRSKFKYIVEHRLRRDWVEPEPARTGGRSNLEKLIAADMCMNGGMVRKVPDPRSRPVRKVGTEWWKSEIGAQEYENEEEGGVLLDPSESEEHSAAEAQSAEHEATEETGVLADDTGLAGLGISM